MALQDEMTFQRIEMLLDVHAKRMQAEFAKLRDELAQAKEELRKEIKLNAPRDSTPLNQWAQQPAPPQWQQAPPQQNFQGQFGAAPSPQWAQAGQGQQYPGYQQGYPQAAQQQSAQPAQKVPSTQPIDRNGVAPSEVSIEKFFYVGGKR